MEFCCCCQTCPACGGTGVVPVWPWALPYPYRPFVPWRPPVRRRPILVEQGPLVPGFAGSRGAERDVRLALT